MKSKLTSYKKLKLENAKLKSDIYELCVNPNSTDALIIRNRILFKNKLSDSTMYGKATMSAKTFNGLYAFIDNNETLKSKTTDDTKRQNT